LIPTLLGHLKRLQGAVIYEKNISRKLDGKKREKKDEPYWT
jgi:hypothetical protein